MDQAITGHDAVPAIAYCSAQIDCTQRRLSTEIGVHLVDLFAWHLASFLSAMTPQSKKTIADLVSVCDKPALTPQVRSLSPGLVGSTPVLHARLLGRKPSQVRALDLKIKTHFVFHNALPLQSMLSSLTASGPCDGIFRMPGPDRAYRQAQLPPSEHLHRFAAELIH